MKENDEVEFVVYFVSEDKKISKLKTIIKAKTKDFEFNNNIDSELNNKYFIYREELWSKSITTIRSKKDIFDFSNYSPIEEEIVMNYFY